MRNINLTSLKNIHSQQTDIISKKNFQNSDHAFSFFFVLKSFNNVRHFFTRSVDHQLMHSCALLRHFAENVYNIIFYFWLMRVFIGQKIFVYIFQITSAIFLSIVNSVKLSNNRRDGVLIFFSKRVYL